MSVRPLPTEPFAVSLESRAQPFALHDNRCHAKFTALGSAFDVREFHQRVLEQGGVPLSALRQHVRAWMRSHALHDEQ